jgi:hypothetical protein
MEWNVHNIARFTTLNINDIHSKHWTNITDIWSRASYRYPISWEAFLDPSDSYFLFADFVDFYTHLTYICKQLRRKMWRKISWTDGRIDRGKTVYPPPPLGSGGIISRQTGSRNLTGPKNSTHNMELLMAEIWYLVTSFI